MERKARHGSASSSSANPSRDNDHAPDNQRASRLHDTKIRPFQDKINQICAHWLYDRCSKGAACQRHHTLNGFNKSNIESSMRGAPYLARQGQLRRDAYDMLNKKSRTQKSRPRSPSKGSSSSEDSGEKKNGRGKRRKH